MPPNITLETRKRMTALLARQKSFKNTTGQELPVAAFD